LRTDLLSHVYEKDGELVAFIFRLDILLLHYVAEYVLYICLFGRAIAGRSCGQFIVIRYKFELPTYIQELLVIGRRGCVQREI
jgi:hypothetical protein